MHYIYISCLTDGLLENLLGTSPQSRFAAPGLDASSLYTIQFSSKIVLKIYRKSERALQNTLVNMCPKTQAVINPLAIQFLFPGAECTGEGLVAILADGTNKLFTQFAQAVMAERLLISSSEDYVDAFVGEVSRFTRKAIFRRVAVRTENLPVVYIVEWVPS